MGGMPAEVADMKIGVVFPGQGSQEAGMGKEMASAFPAAAELLALGETATGIPLREMCFDAPLDALTRTEVCQPCVFAVGLLCWAVCEPILQRHEVLLAGHSLGEYTALTAAGVFAPADAFRLVQRRAAAMEQASSLVAGGMLAVLGRSEDEVRQMTSGHPGVFVANLNAPEQVIVAGAAQPLDAFAAEMRAQRVRIVPLKVSGPFHTPLMAPAAKELAMALDRTPIATARMTVYANCSGLPQTRPDEIRDNLLRQLVSPVRWVDIVQRMTEAGVGLFVELGPKQVLCGLISKIVPDIPCLSVNGPASFDALREFLAEGARC